MYELIQVSEDCFYINCPAKIGIVKTGEQDVCLIDSGNDKDAGKKVKKILQNKLKKIKRRLLERYMIILFHIQSMIKKEQIIM